MNTFVKLRNYINKSIGRLSALTTSADTLTGAINEVGADLGNLSSLTVPTKTDAVSAINSVYSSIYTRIVTTQAEFNALWIRGDSHEYIMDPTITSVILKPGNYYFQPTPADLYGNYTFTCNHWYSEKGAYITINLEHTVELTNGDYIGLDFRGIYSPDGINTTFLSTNARKVSDLSIDGVGMQTADCSFIEDVGETMFENITINDVTITNGKLFDNITYLHKFKILDTTSATSIKFFSSCSNIQNGYISGGSSSTSYYFHNSSYINNVTIYNVSATTAVYGFHTCANLQSCKIDTISSSVLIAPFYTCDYLLDCIVLNSTGGSTATRLFNLCTFLVNCQIKTVIGGGTGASTVGFYSCTNLTNCISDDFTNISSGSGTLGFGSCTQLTNCIAKNITKIATAYNDAAGFVSCTMLSGCIADTIGASASSNTIGIGFKSCLNISNCIAQNITSGSIQWTSGYYLCVRVSGCYANNINALTGRESYGFRECTYINSTCEVGTLDASAPTLKRRFYNCTTKPFKLDGTTGFSLIKDGADLDTGGTPITYTPTKDGFIFGWGENVSGQDDFFITCNGNNIAHIMLDAGNSTWVPFCFPAIAGNSYVFTGNLGTDMKISINFASFV